MNDYTKYWFNSLGAIGKGISFDKTSKGFRPGQAMAFYIVNNSKPKFVIENLDIWSTGEDTSIDNLDYIIRRLSTYNINDIGFWNAHAPGTTLGDTSELKIFQSLVKKDIPIVSLKSHIGHTIRSCFGIEICMGVDNLKNGKILENKNLENPIDIDDRIITKEISSNSGTFFKMCLGFGGKSAAAVVKIYNN